MTPIVCVIVGGIAFIVGIFGDLYLVASTMTDFDDKDSVGFLQICFIGLAVLGAVLALVGFLAMLVNFIF